MRIDLRATREQLEQKLQGKLKSGLTQVEGFVKSFLPANFAIRKYHYLDARQRQFVRDFQAQSGWISSADCFRLATFSFIESFESNSLGIRIPDSISKYAQREHSRILEQLLQLPDEHFRWENDEFVKDFSLCNLRLLPAGAQVIECSGIPKAWILRPSRQMPGHLTFVLGKIRGFAPLLEIHTHKANLDEFNKDGWDRCYVRIGDFLELNPQILGVQGGSWFYDPKLATISPNLAYLQDVPLRHGARLVYIRDEGSDSSALAKSGKRKALFEAGRYRPAAYAMIWGREDLIAFAKANRSLLS